MKIMPITTSNLFKKHNKPPLIKQEGVKMKKLVVILGLCFFCTQQVQAEEVITNQTTSLEDNRVIVSLQNQSNEKQSSQKQDVKRNWFCVIIQINGKAYTDKTNN